MEKTNKAILTKNIFNSLNADHDLLKGLHCFEINCANRNTNSEEAFELLKKLVDEHLSKLNIDS